VSCLGSAQSARGSKAIHGKLHFFRRELKIALLDQRLDGAGVEQLPQKGWRFPESLERKERGADAKHGVIHADKISVSPTLRPAEYPGRRAGGSEGDGQGECRRRIGDQLNAIVVT
jgi:hypothetical protein